MKKIIILLSFVFLSTLSFSQLQVKDTVVHVTNSQLLNIVSTPIDLIEACGSDEVIIVEKIIGQIVDNGDPFNTSVTFTVYSYNLSVGSLHVASTATNYLTFGSGFHNWTITNGTIGTSQYLKGGKVILKAGAAPTNGETELYLYIRYYLLPVLN